MISIGFLHTPSGSVGGSPLPSQVILTSNQSAALNTTTLKFSVPSGNSLTVYWGDGNYDAVTCDGTLKTLTHDYASQATYQISLSGNLDQITDFRCNSQSWIEGDISGVSLLTGLEIFYGYSTSLSGNISSLNGMTSVEILRLDSTSVSGALSGISALASSLEQLRLSNTSVTGSVASLSTFSSLVVLYLSNTAVAGTLSDISGLTSMVNLLLDGSSVSGDIADTSGMTSISNLFLFSSDVDTYTQGTLPAWSNANINLVDLGLDSVEVDDFLNDLDAAGGTNGTLNISGTNAAHSTASDTAISNLETDGWTVTQNDYFITSNQVAALSTTTVEVNVPSGNSLTIRWGDGNTESVTCDGTLQTLTHDYSTQEKWGVDFTGDSDEITSFRVDTQTFVEGDIANLSSMIDLTQIFIYSTSMSGNISAFSSMTSMINLRAQNSSVTGDLSSLSSLTSITDLRLYGTTISGNISNLSGMTGMVTLQIFGLSVSGDISNLSSMTSIDNLRVNSTSVSGNISNFSGMTSATSIRADFSSVSGDLTSISGLSNLTLLYLNDTSINAYTSGALPAWDSCDIDIRNLGLSSTEVDDFIIDLEDSGNNGDNGTLNIAGTNAARTSASDTAYNNLVTDGWTITVNT